MKKYANLHGNSGVDSFSSSATSIKIKFVNGPTIYTYNSTKPGLSHVVKMIALADMGRGLATYINKNVRDNYASKS